MRVNLFVFLFIWLLCLFQSLAFVPYGPRKWNRYTRSSYLSQSVTESSLEQEIRSMRVREIKEELVKLGVSTKDVFEKEELIQRLLQCRKTDKPKPEPTVPSSSGTSGISAPLYFTSLDTDLKVAAVNVDGGITLNPSDQPYATIQIQVEENGQEFMLQLLLDTACSGFVLRPSILDKYNLPKLSTPVTMTGAGGTAGAQGLTQIQTFEFGGQTFGPLPAAVQDIGALPKSLDGIIGLSFLNQFAVVDLDFVNGQLSLYKKGETVPAPQTSASGKLVSQGMMSMIPQLGIYTVDVWLGGRGPVKMLVDSGAANTFLSWYGLQCLGISRDDKSFLKPLNNPMGAMGSDNTVARLTHRIHVSSSLQLGKNTEGLSLKNEKRLNIDIGDIAILENLKSYNVGGILGIDALMRCSSVRLILEPSRQELLILD